MAEASRAGQPHVATVLQAAPVALTGLVLLIVNWSQGSFAVRYWGPLAVLVLVLLALAGSVRRLSGAALVAVAALWGFAAWSLLSALWAESVARALEGGARNALYAGLFTLPIATLSDRRTARALAVALTAGVAFTVLATFGAALWDGPQLFLAGRLDDPIGYRNATAALFALAFWLLVCVAATRRTAPLLRAAAFGVAVLALGLAFLTQSRGVVLGFVAGGVVALLLGPDRVRRAWLVLIAVALLALVAGRLLSPYDAFLDTRIVTAEQIGVATEALAVIAAVAFVLALLIALLDGGLRLSDAAMGSARHLATAGLLLIAVLGVVGALVVVGNPVSFAQEKVQEFRGETVPSVQGRTRLGSTAGQRSDLWRVAVEEWKTAPVGGLGQGNYVTQYYERRGTDRNLFDSHSLPLSILAETGLVGLLLFVTFLVSAVLALIRGLRHASADARRWGSALAAGAAVVVAQAGVDWLWLFPGLAGLALLGLGLAIALAVAPNEAVLLRRKEEWLGAVAAVPVLAAVLAGVLFLADFEVRKARVVGERSAAAQVEAARTAEHLNPYALPPLYLRAGGLEAEGRDDEARAALREALEREPRSFVTLTLMGDLEFRAGRRDVARVLYRRALERNPLDVGLQQLAAQP